MLTHKLIPSFLRRLRLFKYFNSEYSTRIQDQTNLQTFKNKIENGPQLGHFVSSSESGLTEDVMVEKNLFVSEIENLNLGRKVYIETYGCQMNVNDTEIINAILEKDGFIPTERIQDSDVILLMTCAIRDGAEQKIWRRLHEFKALKRKRKIFEMPLKVGILGCMAERLKEKVLDQEKLVDIVAGPDSYRNLPALLSLANSGQKAINVMLSTDETYADIMPVRTNLESKSAFVSIMRGCDNMCSFCIVPFTRGRERSRPVSSIIKEVRHLSDQGYKAITLLGQNVNSYRDLSQCNSSQEISGDILSKGFKTVYKNRAGGLRFADLLVQTADVNPEMKISFTSPHPKDFPDSVLEAIRMKPNISKQIHLPAQSGNSEVLFNMRRGYTRESYLELLDHVRESIPGVALTSDFICGFCGETEEQHQDTLSLIEKVKYEFIYVFPYSMRNKTAAFHRLKDDVPEDVKKRRAMEVAETFRKCALELHQKEIGKEHLVLVTGPSKRSEKDWAGRNEGNTKVIFPQLSIPDHGSNIQRMPCIGDYIVIKINDCSSQVLKGNAMFHTTLQEFAKCHEEKNTFKLQRNYSL